MVPGSSSGGGDRSTSRGRERSPLLQVLCPLLPHADSTFHGWTAPHTTTSCQTIKRMDSMAWARMVAGLLYKCGEFFGRGHKCDFAPCGDCRSPHHPTLRCAHHKGD